VANLASDSTGEARESAMHPVQPLLKMSSRALRNISLNPWRIGKIVAAALVILHIDHNRTT
jgi:hypothetical protein